MLTVSLIPSIISNYALEDGFDFGDLRDAVNRAWNELWEKAPDESFLGWLVNENILELSSSTDKRDFSKHIAPLLLDAASIPEERKLLHTLANNLQNLTHFLKIIPKFETTSASDGASFSSHAVQGVPVFQLKTATSSQEIATLLNSIDSYLIELLINNTFLECLEDAEGQWHLGVRSRRSGLLHELIHVLDMTNGLWPRKGNESFRWDTFAEKGTIEKENLFLRARGEMVRISHKGFGKPQDYRNLSQINKLMEALFRGADGTVKELVKGWTFPALDIFTFCEFAQFYLNHYVTLHSLLIDENFIKEIKKHKEVALKHIITSIVENHPNEKKMADCLLEVVLFAANRENRSDAVPYLEELRLSLGMK